MRQSGLAFLVTVALSALPASATIMQVTWRGTVASSHDPLGLFGPANAPDGSLNGERFVAKFRFDLSAGTRDNSPEEQIVYGLPAVLARLTINGHSEDTRTDNDDTSTYYTDSRYGRFSGWDLNDPLHWRNHIQTVVTSPSIGPPPPEFDEGGDALWFEFSDYDVPPISVVLEQPYVHSFTSWSYPDQIGFFIKVNAQHTHATLLGFNFETLDIRAVPEPASWALMIAGFGLVGAALRQRRVSDGALRQSASATSVREV